MLWSFVIAFLILWFLGLASVYASVVLTWIFFALFVISLIWQIVAARRNPATPIDPKF